jgi:hypothetical protein
VPSPVAAAAAACSPPPLLPIICVCAGQTWVSVRVGQREAAEAREERKARASVEPYETSQARATMPIMTRVVEV